MTCGIYAIKNKMNGKMYIGQSVNVKKRFARHRYQLNNGTHANSHLLMSWNKFGKKAFEFVVLETCQQWDLTVKEQEWLNSCDKCNLYNFIFDVQNVRGESNPFFGKRHTEEAKSCMSEAKKGRYSGKENPNFGNKYSLDARISMTLKNSQTKLTPEQVLQIKELLLNGHNHKDIADSFNISRSVITRISNGKRWSNITGGPILPAVYKDGVRVLSDSHKNKIGQGRQGKKHTEETKNKIRQSRVKRKK